MLNHGWWQLAVGGWRLAAVGGWRLATGGWWRLVGVGSGWWLAVGGWRRLAVVGSWRLVAAGGWRRLVAGGWWRLVVGGWWRLAVDGSWRLAVGGPLGRSLRGVGGGGRGTGHRPIEARRRAWGCCTSQAAVYSGGRVRLSLPVWRCATWTRVACSAGPSVRKEKGKQDRHTDKTERARCPQPPLRTPQPPSHFPLASAAADTAAHSASVQGNSGRGLRKKSLGLVEGMARAVMPERVQAPKAPPEVHTAHRPHCMPHPHK